MPSLLQSPIPRLTEREFEILMWRNDGKSPRAVGRVLSTSEHTVNLHAQGATRKLAVGSKQHTAAKARSLDLI